MSESEAGGQELYKGREQTLVKHFILEKYLERFAHIIGFGWDTITYVDGFSGPWNTQSDELKDSSFCLALNQLRRAQQTHAKKGKPISIRCMFLERDPDAYGKLKAFADKVHDAAVVTLNSAFEDSIDQIIKFIAAGGPKSFPFVFIDPTGWTGFAMDQIARLLRQNRGEVLINFMTSHIRRFIESPQEETQASFERLFGSADYRDKVIGLNQQNREDALVRAYIESVIRVGQYKYVCPAIVLHPEIDRTHFHLIYATRNTKGVEVFKQAEKQAMEMMEEARADAQQRKRLQKTGQSELPFAVEAYHDPGHYESLRNRYLRRAQQRVREFVETQHRVLFDTLWINAMSFPLVWESDLKDWIRDWRNAGIVEVEGLRPREREPKRKANHWIVYRAQGTKSANVPNGGT